MTDGKQTQLSQPELQERVRKLESANPQFAQEITRLREQLEVTTTIEINALQDIAQRVVDLETRMGVEGSGR